MIQTEYVDHFTQWSSLPRGYLTEFTIRGTSIVSRTPLGHAGRTETQDKDNIVLTASPVIDPFRLQVAVRLGSEADLDLPLCDWQRLLVLQKPQYVIVIKLLQHQSLKQHNGLAKTILWGGGMYFSEVIGREGSFT
jgi:hypothetical protein